MTDHMTTAATIIHELGGNHATGKCKCPAHTDKTPSLSVNDGRKGVVFHCHAGCTQEEVIEALRSLNLWPGRTQPTTKPTSKDDWDEKPNRKFEEYKRLRRAVRIGGTASINNQGPPTAYLNGRGITRVWDQLMTLPKEQSRRLFGDGYPAMICAIRSRTGKFRGVHVTQLTRDGKRKLKTKNPRRTFGSPKGGFVKLGTISSKKPLIVAEGIETALSASEIAGVSAIAAVSASNMKVLQVPQCSEVIIAADNDDVGLEAADVLAQRLANSGRKVRIAIPNKGDWNDAINGDVDRAELRRQIVRAKKVKRNTEVRALKMGEFQTIEFPTRDYLMRPWLQQSSLAMVHAKRGSGKTWLMLSVAHAVATGEPLMGWTVEKPVRVLYVDGELPGAELQERLQYFGRPETRLRLLSPDLFYMHGLPMLNLGDEDGRDALDKIIERDKIKLVILDSLSTLLRAGTENEAESWSPIQAWALEHRWRGRSIVFLHHEGRSGKPRGTSKREDVLDTMIGLKERPDLHDLKNHEKAFEFRYTKTRGMYGEDEEARIIRLSTRFDEIEWTHESVAASNVERVAELLSKGMTQTDIAKELNLTPGRISQIKKQVRNKPRTNV